MGGWLQHDRYNHYQKRLVIVNIIWKPLASDRSDNDRLTKGFPSISTIVAANRKPAVARTAQFFSQLITTITGLGRGVGPP